MPKVWSTGYPRQHRRETSLRDGEHPPDAPTDDHNVRPTASCGPNVARVTAKPCTSATQLGAYYTGGSKSSAALGWPSWIDFRIRVTSDMPEIATSDDSDGPWIGRSTPKFCQLNRWTKPLRGG